MKRFEPLTLKMELSDSEKENAAKILEEAYKGVRSIKDIKQELINSLKNIQFDIIADNFEETHEKLRKAQIYFVVWYALVFLNIW